MKKYYIGHNEACKHDRQKARCRDCAGSQICKHNRLRDRCSECGGLFVVATLMYRSAKYRAKKSGVPFHITVKDILELVETGVCPALKIPFDHTSRRQVDASATLDKFNPRLGYVKGNCAVISRLANMIKTKATTEQVRKVADWMESRETKGVV